MSANSTNCKTTTQPNHFDINDGYSSQIEPCTSACVNIHQSSADALLGEPGVLEAKLHQDEIMDLDNKNAVVDGKEVNTQCGIGPYRPECLQKFATRKWMLFWMCWFCFVQGILVNGLVPSVFTTIERRFNFHSSTLGRIMQWYDIGYVLCCIPVSYFGGRHSKPLVLGLGLLVMGVGSFLFSLPHIISDAHQYKERNYAIGECTSAYSNSFISSQGLNESSLKDNFGQCNAVNVDSTWWIQRYRFEILFCIAHLLHGIGATPLFTLGVSYIDENVKPTLSPLFIGIFYTVVIFGPAIGFVMSATFLRFHTDFLSYQRPNIGVPELDEKDDTWVGAWWIGFQIASILALFAVFPILSFPKTLPGAAKYQKTHAVNQRRIERSFTPSTAIANNSQVAVAPVEDVEIKKASLIRRLLSDVQHIPAAVKRLLTNPSYMCITLSASFEGLLITGLSGFMAKYLERQFNVHSSRANLLIGCIMIPFAGLGTLVSGYVVKRFRLTCTKTLKFCICMAVLSALLSPMFLVYCEPARLAGVEAHYPTDPSTNETTLNKESQCNKHCICNELEFHPVCATSKLDNKRVAFFSSCYAGCPERRSKKEEYANCTCAENSKVEAGWCESKCSALIGFLILFAPMVYCTFSVGVPALSVILRCVDYDERSFALGIQWILIRCIGTIPAPVIFAWLFDVSCLVRKMTKECDTVLASNVTTTGTCLIYDNKMLADLFLAFTLIGKTVALLFLILALIFYRRSGREDLMYTDTNQVSTHNEASGGVELVEFSPSNKKKLSLSKN